MDTHTDVELVLSAELDQVLVAANSAGFQSLGTQLFILVGHEMDAQREILDGRLLSAQIEDANLRVWHTTAEPGLGVRLILAVAITKMIRRNLVNISI